MKVSIVIPVYNVSLFIERSLSSALNQTYSDIEIIVVDDASPDSSIEIAKRITGNHPRKDFVNFISHPRNKGLGAARNTGVRASSGDYIFFLDSDDEISNHCIETLVSAAGNSNTDLVLGEIEVIGNKRNAYPLLLLKEGIYYGNKKILDTFLRKKWYEMAWNKLIKRTLFTENQLWFNEKILHEDTLWSFEMALVIQSMAITTLKTYLYYIQENSITQKKSAKNIESFFYVIKKIIDEAKEKNLFYTHPSLYSYLQGLKIYFIKNLINNKLEKDYILTQKEQIDNLYNLSVWNSKKPFFISKIKEDILNLILKRKLNLKND